MEELHFFHYFTRLSREFFTPAGKSCADKMIRVENSDSPKIIEVFSNLSARIAHY